MNAELQAKVDKYSEEIKSTLEGSHPDVNQMASKMVDEAIAKEKSKYERERG